MIPDYPGGSLPLRLLHSSLNTVHLGLTKRAEEELERLDAEVTPLAAWRPVPPRVAPVAAGLPFDSSHIHGWRNVLTGMEIGEVPKMAVYEGRIRPRFG